MNVITPFAVAKPRPMSARYKKRLREQADAAIQYLIDLIDQIDGDPDFEPSLGAPEQPFYYGQPAVRWARGANDDREDEHDGREHEEDAEHDGCEPEEGDHWRVRPFVEDQTHVWC